jgi:hypothetical protein
MSVERKVYVCARQQLELTMMSSIANRKRSTTEHNRTRSCNDLCGARQEHMLTQVLAAHMGTYYVQW